jgi:molybdopterin-guanine dinucleotide biosynthesis protein MobB
MTNITKPTAVPAVAFVGKQNSGKTVLLEKIVTALTDDAIRVATIKHHSHAGFEFDIEGKDSWRHRQAGSTQTIVVAPDQIASVRKLSKEIEVKQVIETMLFESAVYGQMPQIILVEGYRYGGLPTIELFRADNPNDAERNLGVESNEVVAVVTDIERVAKQAKNKSLPVFGFEDIKGICGFLIGKYIEI